MRRNTVRRHAVPAGRRADLAGHAAGLAGETAVCGAAECGDWLGWLADDTLANAITLYSQPHTLPIFVTETLTDGPHNCRQLRHAAEWWPRLQDRDLSTGWPGRSWWRRTATPSRKS